MNRRRTELGLIVLAAILITGLYVLASLGKSASLPAHIGPFLAIFLGLLLVGHLAVRRFAPRADGILLPVAGLLNGIGYVFIARLDPHLSGLQSTWTALGIGSFVATLAIVRRARDLDRYRYTLMAAGIGLLLMPLVPHFGQNINGARLWVRVGPITFQPGELAKIALAIFFASYLVERGPILHEIGKGVRPNVRTLGPVLLAWGFSLVVMTAEKDLGSSLLFFAFFLAMLWLASNRAVYLAIGAVLFTIGSAFAYESFNHVRVRVTIWLNPWPHSADIGYQLLQGLFAMGSGGFGGTGPGLGSPQNIPAAATDFIFATIGEELGLLGTAAVVVAFLLMVGVGLRIAVRADQPFDKLLAAGLTTILAVQSFIIMGGVTRLLPLTGITLPFVSYGGSSLIANYILLALLLRISNDTIERAERAVADELALSSETQVGAGVISMDSQIRKLGIVLMALFVALFLQLNYVQVVAAHKLSTDPRNTRAIIRDFSRKRGTITTADGTVVAQSVPSDDRFKVQRVYPQKDLFAQVTGYFSFTFGTEGVEKTYNDDLVGRTPSIKRLFDFSKNQDQTGSLTLTLKTAVQTVARQALGNRKGAVVAINPADGSVLALWSSPSYDPNPLAGHDQKAVTATWKAANADINKPLLPRTYRERYFPGSTFKVVTSAAVLEKQPDLATKTYPTLTALDLPQTKNQKLANFGGERCGGQLPQLLKVSCNTGFAQIGLDMGAQNLTDEARAFGFYDRPPLDLPAVARSAIPDPSAFAHDLPGLAKSAIGQQDVQATPLQMALVAAGIANGGTIMKPHVLQSIRDAEGNVVRQFSPEAWMHPMSEPNAAALRDMMVGVVQGGTATGAAIPGVQVAAKTGTAQTGTPNTSHAWLIAFAPASAPKVAVAVIVESQTGVGDAATGGRVAAPIAKAVMSAALSAP